jgi:hypothetical protein
MTASYQIDITKRINAMVRAGQPMFVRRPAMLKLGPLPESWKYRASDAGT